MQTLFPKIKELILHFWNKSVRIIFFPLKGQRMPQESSPAENMWECEAGTWQALCLWVGGNLGLFHPCSSRVGCVGISSVTWRDSACLGPVLTVPYLYHRLSVYALYPLYPERRPSSLLLPLGTVPFHFIIVFSGSGDLLRCGHRLLSGGVGLPGLNTEGPVLGCDVGELQ